MADERLKLRELGVRVEAMFEWPGSSGGDPANYSLPDAAAEISERLQALERRLSPGPLDHETGHAPTEVAPAQLAPGTESAPPTAPSPLSPVAGAEIIDRLRSLDDRLAGLQSLDEARALEQRLVAIEQLVEGIHEIPALAEIAEHVGALTQRVDEIGPATARMIEGLEHLRAIDERLGSQQSEQEERALGERVAGLERALDTRDPIATALAERVARLEQAPLVPGPPDPALDEVFDRLTSLESSRPNGDLLAEVAVRLAHLEEAPAASATALEEILERLTSLEGQLATTQSAEQGRAVAERLDQLLADQVAPETLNAISERLDTLAARIEEPAEDPDALSRLVERLDGIEQRLAEPTPVPEELSALSDRVEELGQHLEELRAETALREAEDSARDRKGASESRDYFAAGAMNPSPVLDNKRPASAPVEDEVSPYYTSATSLPSSELSSDPFADLVRAAVASAGDSGSATADFSSDDSVLELLRRDLAPLHDEYGPLTVAPDPVQMAAPPVTIVEESQPPPGRRFKKLLR